MAPLGNNLPTFLSVINNQSLNSFLLTSYFNFELLILPILEIKPSGALLHVFDITLVFQKVGCDLHIDITFSVKESLN